jgi:hypothetical protein
VHDRDLPGRAAEADEAELEPEAQGFHESRRWRHGDCCFLHLTAPSGDFGRTRERRQTGEMAKSPFRQDHQKGLFA